MPDSSEHAFAEHLVERVRDQLLWYNAKAMQLQQRSSYLKIVEVVLASILPILISLAVPRIYPLLISVVVVILISTAQFWQFDAKWRQYRLISDQLRRELRTFELGGGEYEKLDHEARLKLFAERTTRLIDDETSRWFYDAPVTPK